MLRLGAALQKRAFCVLGVEALSALPPQAAVIVNMRPIAKIVPSRFMLPPSLSPARWEDRAGLYLTGSGLLKHRSTWQRFLCYGHPMQKRIVILDPNGIEVALVVEGADKRPFAAVESSAWEDAVDNACGELIDALKHENPKLGTYTVTVKEIGDD